MYLFCLDNFCLSGKCNGSLNFTVFQAQNTQSHTILLVQPSEKPETRTYSDYETVDECMEGIKHKIANL